MFDAVSISEKVSFKIANELNLDKDKREVISYGIFSIVQMIYNLILVLLVGGIFGVSMEALIVSLSIGVLKKSSGGVHSSSSGICLVVGTIISVGIGLLSRIRIGMEVTIGITIITFIWAYYIIYKLAPVDSSAKPIRTEKKRKRLKRSSIFILNIYLVIVIFNIVLYVYTNINSLIFYSICILGGVIWQVLSLTKIGHYIVKLIDTFFNKILMYKKGGIKNEKN